MQEVSFKVAVAELSQSPYFRAIVQEIASRAPYIPDFDPTGPTNIEEIKFALAQRKLHELVMSILSPKGKAE